jgi:hypothetical protein
MDSCLAHDSERRRTRLWSVMRKIAPVPTDFRIPSGADAKNGLTGRGALSPRRRARIRKTAITSLPLPDALPTPTGGRRLYGGEFGFVPGENRPTTPREPFQEAHL